MRETPARSPMAACRTGIHTMTLRQYFTNAILLAALLYPLHAQERPVRLEDMRGKTILLFTPHPDDDTFCCAGTLSILARNANKVYIVIYTNDDKGSLDPEMTSERLARIRKAEGEGTCHITRLP